MKKLQINIGDNISKILLKEAHSKNLNLSQYVLLVLKSRANVLSKNKVQEFKGSCFPPLNYAFVNVSQVLAAVTST